jgi:hypothetical protein
MANLRYPTKTTKFLAGELVNVDNPIPKDYSGLVSTIDLETKWDDHGIVFFWDNLQDTPIHLIKNQ